MQEMNLAPYIAEAERLRVLGANVTRDGELILRWRSEGECRDGLGLTKLINGFIGDYL